MKNEGTTTKPRVRITEHTSSEPALLLITAEHDDSEVIFEGFFYIDSEPDGHIDPDLEDEAMARVIAKAHTDFEVVEHVLD